MEEPVYSEQYVKQFKLVSLQRLLLMHGSYMNAYIDTMITY